MEQKNAEEMKQMLPDASNSFSEEKTSSEESEELSEHVQEDDDVQMEELSQFDCENAKEKWTESEKSSEDSQENAQKYVEDTRLNESVETEAKDESSEDTQESNQSQSECQKSFRSGPRWVILPNKEEVEINIENRSESLTKREKSSENIQENKNGQTKLLSKKEENLSASMFSPETTGNDYLGDQSSSDSTNGSTLGSRSSGTNSGIQSFSFSFSEIQFAFDSSSSSNFSSGILKGSSADSSEEIQTEDVEIQENSSNLVQNNVRVLTETAKPPGTVRSNEGTAETNSVPVNQPSTADRGSSNIASNNPEASPVPEEASTSKIASMLPDKLIWKWENPTRTSGANQYFASIRRGREMISVGDSVSFYCLYRNEKPYIGKIVKLWSNHKSQMKVKSNWFYRPEELDQPCKLTIPVIHFYLF